MCHFYSHAEVCKPGILYFFKDKKAASSALAMARSSSESAEVLIERAATGKVDLRQVTEFSIPAESNVQLFIKRPKEMVKIRQAYVYIYCILVVTSSYVSPIVSAGSRRRTTASTGRACSRSGASTPRATPVRCPLLCMLISIHV